MCESPSRFEPFANGALSNEQMLFLDQASSEIAWLLSPRKRYEQLQDAALVNAEDLDSFELPDLGPEPPFDDLLIPIEGRGPTKEQRLDTGMGPACVIAPAEVARYARMLSKLSEADLRQHLNFKALDEAWLPVCHWQEEGERTFCEYILPMFGKLQSFYNAAAAKQQHMLVWYS